MTDSKVIKLPAQLIEMIYDQRETCFPPSWKRQIYEFVDTISVPNDVLRGRLIIKRESDCTWWAITYRLSHGALKPWERSEMGADYPADLELRQMIRREKVTYTWQEA